MLLCGCFKFGFVLLGFFYLPCSWKITKGADLLYEGESN